MDSEDFVAECLKCGVIMSKMSHVMMSHWLQHHYEPPKKEISDKEIEYQKEFMSAVEKEIEEDPLGFDVKEILEHVIIEEEKKGNVFASIEDCWNNVPTIPKVATQVPEDTAVKQERKIPHFTCEQCGDSIEGFVAAVAHFEEHERQLKIKTEKLSTSETPKNGSGSGDVKNSSNDSPVKDTEANLSPEVAHDTSLTSQPEEYIVIDELPDDDSCVHSNAPIETVQVITERTLPSPTPVSNSPRLSVKQNNHVLDISEQSSGNQPIQDSLHGVIKSNTDSMMVDQPIKNGSQSNISSRSSSIADLPITVPTATSPVSKSSNEAVFECPPNLNKVVGQRSTSVPIKNATQSKKSSRPSSIADPTISSPASRDSKSSSEAAVECSPNLDMVAGQRSGSVPSEHKIAQSYSPAVVIPVTNPRVKTGPQPSVLTNRNISKSFYQPIITGCNMQNSLNVSAPSIAVPHSRVNNEVTKNQDTVNGSPRRNKSLDSPSGPDAPNSTRNCAVTTPTVKVPALKLANRESINVDGKKVSPKKHDSPMAIKTGNDIPSQGQTPDTHILDRIEALLDQPLQRLDETTSLIKTPQTLNVPRNSYPVPETISSTGGSLKVKIKLPRISCQDRVMNVSSAKLDPTSEKNLTQKNTTTEGIVESQTGTTTDYAKNVTDMSSNVKGHANVANDIGKLLMQDPEIWKGPMWTPKQNVHRILENKVHGVEGPLNIDGTTRDCIPRNNERECQQEKENDDINVDDVQGEMSVPLPTIIPPPKTKVRSSYSAARIVKRMSISQTILKQQHNPPQPEKNASKEKIELQKTISKKRKLLGRTDTGSRKVERQIEVVDQTKTPTKFRTNKPRRKHTIKTARIRSKSHEIPSKSTENEIHHTVAAKHRIPENEPQVIAEERLHDGSEQACTTAREVASDDEYTSSGCNAKEITSSIYQREDPCISRNSLPSPDIGNFMDTNIENNSSNFVDNSREQEDDEVMTISSGSCSEPETNSYRKAEMEAYLRRIANIQEETEVSPLKLNTLHKNSSPKSQTSPGNSKEMKIISIKSLSSDNSCSENGKRKGSQFQIRNLLSETPYNISRDCSRENDHQTDSSNDSLSDVEEVDNPRKYRNRAKSTRKKIHSTVHRNSKGRKPKKTQMKATLYNYDIDPSYEPDDIEEFGLKQKNLTKSPLKLRNCESVALKPSESSRHIPSGMYSSDNSYNPSSSDAESSDSLGDSDSVRSQSVKRRNRRHSSNSMKLHGKLEPVVDHAQSRRAAFLPTSESLEELERYDDSESSLVTPSERVKVCVRKSRIKDNLQEECTDPPKKTSKKKEKKRQKKPVNRRRLITSTSDSDSTKANSQNFNVENHSSSSKKSSVWENLVWNSTKDGASEHASEDISDVSTFSSPLSQDLNDSMVTSQVDESPLVRCMSDNDGPHQEELSQNISESSPNLSSQFSYENINSDGVHETRPPLFESLSLDPSVSSSPMSISPDLITAMEQAAPLPQSDEATLETSEEVCPKPRRRTARKSLPCPRKPVSFAPPSEETLQKCMFCTMMIPQNQKAFLDHSKECVGYSM